jgi:hypothetical protein
MSTPAGKPPHPPAAVTGWRHWLRPRSEERIGRGEVRLIETVVLVLVGVFLAVATIHDVARQVPVGERLSADLESWREIVGAYYHNPLTEQDVKHYTTRDIECADTTYGKPYGKPQVCLIFTGPVKYRRRVAYGGFHLLAGGTDVHEPVLDVPKYRYACWGTAVAEGLCEAKAPPRFPTKAYVDGFSSPPPPLPRL